MRPDARRAHTDKQAAHDRDMRKKTEQHCLLNAEQKDAAASVSSSGMNRLAEVSRNGYCSGRICPSPFNQKGHNDTSFA